ncbi:glucose 1-dehydrogenase [Saccharopolyspora shandongensis]|uniref:3-oxoacyl-[acyl-carrier protein] reductase n=1 Tax=Saccharopolyspora shandongensis TaxID=418495 RepID=A0A1H3HQ19_9PSEU|nr:glucose 1-dehydrogenase [Saccharopolyspora shandongensis]SDY16769.1 3-oxoacyl-[acyl-carrier protein] reductase [Saccharopolyspora shandongensis]
MATDSTMARKVGRTTFDFTGQVVIVTGASGGIGSALAAKYAEAGADVVVHGRNVEALQANVERVEELGQKAVLVTGNIREPETAEALVGTALDRFGRIDVLINNAGGNFASRLEDLSVNAWNATIGTNLSGAFHCSRACLPVFERQGGGNIINVGSGSANHAHPMRGAYAAAKAGLASLTKTMAWEWADRGIRVNCVEPGATLTPASRFASPETEKKFGYYLALGRVGRPEEVADACLYLTSEAASFITGTVLQVTGGPHTSSAADVGLIREPRE